MRSILACLVALACLIATGADAFYGNGYRYCKRLTIDGTLVAGPGPHVDFPVLVSLTDPDLRTVPNGGHVEHASGWDLVFLNAAETTLLDHEIEEYDGMTGRIVMWVRVPSLPSGTDTDLHMYYGNPSIAASQESAAGVFSNGYEAVWHLDDDFLDSSGNGRTGTNFGSADVAAQIADGQDFDPVEEIRTGTYSVSGSALTIQAWGRYPAFGVDDPRILSKATSGSPQDHVFMLSLSGSGEQHLRMRVKTGTDDATGTTTLLDDTTPLSTNTWYHLAGTYDGSTMRLFVDGTEVKSTAKTGSLRINAWEVWIGNNPNNGGPGWAASDADFDEARISSTARSAAWLLTERNNGANQDVGAGTFIRAASSELDCIGLEIQKRAFRTDGTPVSNSATLPRGTRVKFLLYVNNRGGAIDDVSLEDVLDPLFTYLATTIRVDSSVAACAADTCTAAEEAAIFAAVDAIVALTDAVDGDVAARVGSTVHAGDRTVANARLDLPADRVLALLFTVKVE